MALPLATVILLREEQFLNAGSSLVREEGSSIFSKEEQLLNASSVFLMKPSNM